MEDNIYKGIQKNKIHVCPVLQKQNILKKSFLSQDGTKQRGNHHLLIWKKYLRDFGGKTTFGSTQGILLAPYSEITPASRDYICCFETYMNPYMWIEPRSTVDKANALSTISSLWPWKKCLNIPKYQNNQITLNNT